MLQCSDNCEISTRFIFDSFHSARCLGLREHIKTEQPQLCIEETKMQKNKDTFAFEDSFDAVKEATEVFDDFSDEVQDALTSFNSHCRPDC